MILQLVGSKFIVIFLKRITKTFHLDPLNPFGYLPNLDLAIVSTAVYGAVTLLLTMFTIYYRTWYFLVMTISGISEVVGYAYRWSLAKDPDQRTPYVFLFISVKKLYKNLKIDSYLRFPKGTLSCTVALFWHQLA